MAEAKNAVAKADDIDPAMLEKVLVHGDVSALTNQQRMSYYRMRCEAAGLDYRAQPFAYMQLQGKLTLYCTKQGAQQLCLKRKISTKIVSCIVDDQAKLVFYNVTASTPDGQTADECGFASLIGKFGELKGEDRGNAYLKALTKAKRRAVLALCGLGELDETEVDDVKGSIKLDPDEIQGEAKILPKDSVDIEGVTGKRRAARVHPGAEAKTEEAKPVNWEDKLPKEIGGGLLKKMRPCNEGVAEKAADMISTMGGMVRNHWTSETGKPDILHRLTDELEEYGYSMDTAVAQSIRKIKFEDDKPGDGTAEFTVTMTEDQLDAAAGEPTAKGKHPGKTPIQIAEIDRPFMEEIAKRDDPFGEMARHALKKVDAKPAPAKAPPAKPAAAKPAAANAAKAAAAAAKAKAKPVDPKVALREKRAEAIRSQHKAAGVDLDEETLASYLEPTDDMDDESFAAYLGALTD